LGFMQKVPHLITTLAEPATKTTTTLDRVLVAAALIASIVAVCTSFTCYLLARHHARQARKAAIFTTARVAQMKGAPSHGRDGD
jgi:hypothetical protein